MADKIIKDFIEEIKPDLCEHKYGEILNSEDMSWEIFELCKTQEIHSRIVAYPLVEYSEDVKPEYEFQLKKYPKIDLIYNYLNNTEEKALIMLIDEIENFNFKIDDNYILYVDGEQNLLSNFSVENGHLMYDIGNIKGLHWSVLIKYSSGWKDFDYTGMDYFYHPIYSKSKLEKYIIQEYDPNST